MPDPIKLQKMLHWIGTQRGAGLSEDQINAQLHKAGNPDTVQEYMAMVPAAMNPARSATQEVSRGLTSMIPGADKLLGTVGAVGDLSQSPGDAYRQVSRSVRGEQAGFATEHPKAAFTLPILGGAAAGGAALPETVGKLATFGMGSAVGAGVSAADSPDWASVPGRLATGAIVGGPAAVAADALLGAVARRLEPTRMGSVAAADAVRKMAGNTGTTSVQAGSALAGIEAVRPGLSMPVDANPQWAQDLRANVNSGVGNTQKVVSGVRLRAAGAKDRMLGDLQTYGGAHPEADLPAQGVGNPVPVRSPASVPQAIARRVASEGDRLYDPLRAATPNGIPFTDRLRAFLLDRNVAPVWADVRPLGGKTDAVQALMDRGATQAAAEASVAARGVGNPSFDQYRALLSSLKARGDAATISGRSDIARTMYERADQLKSIMEQTPQLKGLAAANREYAQVNSLNDAWDRGQKVTHMDSPQAVANDINQVRTNAGDKYADAAVDAYRRGAMQNIFTRLSRTGDETSGDIARPMRQIAAALFPNQDAYEAFMARALADGTFAEQARDLTMNSSTAGQLGAMTRGAGSPATSMVATTHGGAYMRLSEGLSKLVGNPTLARATAIRFRDLLSTPGAVNRDAFLKAIDGYSGEPNLGGAGAAGGFAATPQGQHVGSAEFHAAGAAVNTLLRTLGVGGQAAAPPDVMPAAPTTVPQ